MMKAQIRDTGDQVVLQVCGRLTEGWVAELERCWQAARTNQPDRRFSVDLRGVTFVDQAGERLLRSMHRDGASLLAAGLHVQEIVTQIIGSK